MSVAMRVTHILTGSLKIPATCHPLISGKISGRNEIWVLYIVSKYYEKK
jgi:uncharacterized membrane protein